MDRKGTTIRRQALMFVDCSIAEGATGTVNGDPWEVLTIRDVRTPRGIAHREALLQRVVEAR